MPAKKKKRANSILLANNPRDDNSCQCFAHDVPSADWIVIARYATMEQCKNVVETCGEFFMMMPIKKPHRKMMG